jgi:hypothetical protein
VQANDAPGGWRQSADIENSRCQDGRSACTEVGNITGGTVADIGATGRKDFRGVDRSHHLSAARAHAIVHEKAVEADPFVAERITFIRSDHGGREPCNVFGRGEAWPGRSIRIPSFSATAVGGDNLGRCRVNWMLTRRFEQ